MRVILGIFGCIFSCAFLLPVSVGAEAYDWTDGNPVTRSSQPAILHWSPNCQTYYQDIEVKGQAGRISACMFEGERLDIGVTTGSHGPPKAVVRYPFDTQFHTLEGACNGLVSCIYMSETDSLITRFYASSTYLGVEIFKNVSRRIQRHSDPLTASVRFIFDSSLPDFTLAYEGGLPLPVEGIASSKNGKWAVIEYREFGVVVVNMETFEMRRVLAQGMKYGFGFDPSVEMAITNDGQTLAVMGERAGLTMIKIVPDCGDKVRIGMGQLFDGSVAQCPSVSMPSEVFSYGFRGGYDPVFDDSGGQLTFVVRDQDYSHRQVRIRVSNYHSAALDYLGMGDSFSSGEGEIDDTQYLLGTNEKFEKCHTSARSYPFLLGSLINRSSTRNVACSGAKLKDVLGGGATYWGQGDRLGVSGLRLPEFEAGFLQTQALLGFRPGRVLQARFIERYEPQLVTIGIGGNDAGLMTKLRDCAMPGLCEWITDENRAKVKREIGRLFDPLVNIYRRLLELSPMSRVLAVGYPRIIQPAGDCDLVTGVLFERPERDFIDENMTLLNRVVEKAAHVANVQYVDVSGSFQSHELCSGATKLAMNGLRLGDDIALSKLLPLRLIGSETFHPTPYGHELLAQALYVAYGQGVSDCDSCSEEEESDSVEILHSAEFVTPTLNTNEIGVSMPEETMSPSSTVEITLGRMSLGTVTANERGGLRQKITLPAELNGFYTVHLLATSYTNQKIDFYQGIVVGEWGKESVAEGVVWVRSDKPMSGTVVFSAGNVDRAPDGTTYPSVLGEKSDSPQSGPEINYSYLLITGGAILLLIGIMAVWRIFEK